MLVKTIHTSCTQKDLCKAIIECWRELYGTTPIKASVGVIISQRGIETGGGTYMWNWNVGNVKYSKSTGNVDYMALKGVWEIINGKRIELTPSDPGSWFRSFPTLNDGVRFHLQLLRNTRYGIAWSAIEMGDISMFATLLRQRGYYTAPLADYIAGMNRFFLPYMKSSDYDRALLEAVWTAPPLQPWVTLDMEPLPMDELTALPEEPVVIPMNKSIFSKIMALGSSIPKWLKS